MANFETSIAVDFPIEKVFDFFLRPENVMRLSPPDLGLVFVDPPEVVESGSRLEFKIQGWGQVQTLVHEITSLVTPKQIIEQQVKGPFQRWVHEHSFRIEADGRVLVTDRIDFEPPGGLIGFLITKQKILDHLEDGFAHRHDKLPKLLATC